MDTIPPTIAERDALFAKLFNGVIPVEKKQATLSNVLRPFRRQIIAKRKQGYSVGQIVEGLKKPPFSLDVSTATLRLIIGGAAASRRARLKKIAAARAAQPAAAKSAPVPAKSSVQPSAVPTTPPR